MIMNDPFSVYNSENQTFVLGTYCFVHLLPHAELVFMQCRFILLMFLFLLLK